MWVECGVKGWGKKRVGETIGSGYCLCQIFALTLQVLVTAPRDDLSYNMNPGGRLTNDIYGV